MPKIKHSLAQGFGKGELYDMLVAVKNDLAAQKVIVDDIKDKYEAHCHLTAGAAGTGTKPSTGGATEGTTPSTIVAKTALTVTS